MVLSVGHQHRCDLTHHCLGMLYTLSVACSVTSCSIYVLCFLLWQVEYLLCYACAGSQVQICAMRLGTPGIHQFRRPLSLHTLEDRLQIVWVAVQCYWVMKAQAKQLPAVCLPVGRIETTTFSKVQIYDNFAQKRITYSDDAWPHSRCQLMKRLYAANRDCPYLICAQQPPHASHSGKQYVVDLEPVGQPVLSKYSDQRPQCSRDLKNSIRCAPFSRKTLASLLPWMDFVIISVFHLCCKGL